MTDKIVKAGERLIWRENEKINLFCCDCGLVHTVKIQPKRGFAFVQFWRNQRTTNKYRKEHGITVT